MDGDPGIPGEAGEPGVPGARGVPGKDVCAQKYITLSKCHNIVVFCVQGRPGVDGIDGFNGTDGTPGGDGIQGPPVRTLYYHLNQWWDLDWVHAPSPFSVAWLHISW